MLRNNRLDRPGYIGCAPGDRRDVTPFLLRTCLGKQENSLINFRSLLGIDNAAFYYLGIKGWRTLSVTT